MSASRPPAISKDYFFLQDLEEQKRTKYKDYSYKDYSYKDYS